MTYEVNQMEIPSSKVHMDLSVATSKAPRRQNLAPLTANSANSTRNTAEKITFSQAARALAAKDGEAGNTLDFSNIRPNDILETVNDLIKSGQMSLDESSALLELVPPRIRALPNATAGSNEPINMFTRLEAMLAYNKSEHNDAAAIYDQKAIDALRHLQGTVIETLPVGI